MEVTFVVELWTEFQSIATLPMAAGVAPALLKRLVAKELADNALDAAGVCGAGVKDGMFWVEDRGAGITGSLEEIALRFSVRKDRTTTKLLRLPTRGALGNGLRVVTGYAAATRGSLRLFSNGRIIDLFPQSDGYTTANLVGEYDKPGTRIEMRLGKGYLFTPSDFVWVRRAIHMSGKPTYTAKASSPFWYDESSFYSMCRASTGYIRNLVENLDGCSGAKAGKITKAWNGRLANSLSEDEAAQILALARQQARPFNAKRLDYIGKDAFPSPNGYEKADGYFMPVESENCILKASVPFVVEAWVMMVESDGPAKGVDTVEFNVNRTPVTGEMHCWRGNKKTDFIIDGCGLNHKFENIPSSPIRLVVNVQTPYMPVESHGKAPNFEPMDAQLFEIIPKAAKKAKATHKSVNPTPSKRAETVIIREVLDTAIAKASGNGASRYSLRQLYYQVRPYIIEELGKEPTYENFGKIITAIEGERGADLPHIYRDTRGTLLHPHTGEEISLGTLTVEGYKRPEWTFNKILYCEKEGFFQLLKDTKWPERHDCALVTAKGQPTRAARDVIDLLGETNQELTFFCIHDADAAGTIIYQSLQEATAAREARKVKIINLGLEPKEADEMGLIPEKVEETKRGRPVAKYVDDEWRVWLQSNRVELNAMTSPQFIEWLDRKMEEHDGEKLVPPVEVLTQQLKASTRAKIASIETSKVLTAANIEGRVSAAMGRMNFSAASYGVSKSLSV